MAVYVIGPKGGPYKIGKGGIPQDRLKALQTGHWQELKLVACFGSMLDDYELEEMFHNKFEDKRIRGEWFDLTEQDIQEMKDMAPTFTDQIRKTRTTTVKPAKTKAKATRYRQPTKPKPKRRELVRPDWIVEKDISKAIWDDCLSRARAQLRKENLNPRDFDDTSLTLLGQAMLAHDFRWELPKEVKPLVRATIQKMYNKK